jgi:hypothetical protein
MAVAGVFTLAALVPVSAGSASTSSPELLIGSWTSIYGVTTCAYGDATIGISGYRIGYSGSTSGTYAFGSCSPSNAGLVQQPQSYWVRPGLYVYSGGVFVQCALDVWNKNGGYNSTVLADGAAICGANTYYTLSNSCAYLGDGLHCNSPYPISAGPIIIT